MSRGPGCVKIVHQIIVFFLPRTLQKKRQVACSSTKMASLKMFLHRYGFSMMGAFYLRLVLLEGFSKSIPNVISVLCYFVVRLQESRRINGEGNQCSSPQQCAFSARLPGDYGLRAAYQFRVVCTMCFPLPDNDQSVLRICTTVLRKLSK